MNLYTNSGSGNEYGERRVIFDLNDNFFDFYVFTFFKRTIFQNDKSEIRLSKS